MIFILSRITEWLLPSPKDVRPKVRPPILNPHIDRSRWSRPIFSRPGRATCLACQQQWLSLQSIFATHSKSPTSMAGIPESALFDQVKRKVDPRAAIIHANRPLLLKVTDKDTCQVAWPPNTDIRDIHIMVTTVTIRHVCTFGEPRHQRRKILTIFNHSQKSTVARSPRRERPHRRRRRKSPRRAASCRTQPAGPDPAQPPLAHSFVVGPIPDQPKAIRAALFAATERRLRAARARSRRGEGGRARTAATP